MFSIQGKCELILILADRTFDPPSPAIALYLDGSYVTNNCKMESKLLSNALLRMMKEVLTRTRTSLRASPVTEIPLKICPSVKNERRFGVVVWTV